MKHTKIEFPAGCHLTEAADILAYHKLRGEYVVGYFNGIALYSDTDDVDSVFKRVTGSTKSEYDAMYKPSKKVPQNTPEKAKEWIEAGKLILDKKYHEKWEKCVPIRLDDLYQGMELPACLDIVKELNAGCEMQKAKEIIQSQGHSGMSFGLVCSMVKSFCDRGEAFVAYVR